MTKVQKFVLRQLRAGLPVTWETTGIPANRRFRYVLRIDPDCKHLINVHSYLDAKVGKQVAQMDAGAFAERFEIEQVSLTQFASDKAAAGWSVCVNSSYQGERWLFNVIRQQMPTFGLL